MLWVLHVVLALQLEAAHRKNTLYVVYIEDLDTLHDKRDEYVSMLEKVKISQRGATEGRTDQTIRA